MPKKGIGQKLILFLVMIALGIGLIVGLNQMVKTSDDQEQARTEQVEQQDETEADEETDEVSTPEIDKENESDKENPEANEGQKETTEEEADIGDGRSEEKQVPPATEKREQPKPSCQKKDDPQTSVKKEVKNPPPAEKPSKPKDQDVVKEEQKPPKQEVVETPPPPPPTKKTAQLTIVGSEDIGVILNTVEVEIQETDTVLDVLQRTLREKKIQISVRGGGAGAYVEGIYNLYEFDRGPGSGWMYSVNGSFPNRSAGVWPVQEGEHIRWLYTVDLGKDLGAGQ